MNLKEGSQLTLSICYKPGNEETLNIKKIRKKFLIFRFIILKMSIKFDILIILIFFENIIRKNMLPLFNDDVLFYYFNLNNDKKEGEEKSSFLETKHLIEKDINGKTYSFSKGLKKTQKNNPTSSIPFIFEFKSDYEKRQLKILGLPEKFNPKTNIFDNLGLNESVFKDKIIEHDDYSELFNEKNSVLNDIEIINETENKNDNKYFENFKKIFVKNQYLPMDSNDFLILRCIGVNRKPLLGYYDNKFNIKDVIPIGYSNEY